MSERKCGACTACCVSLSIEGKAAGEPCPLLRANGRGCGKYGDRPEVCQLFRCTWLNGEGDDDERPDRSGILAHASVNDMMKSIGLNVVECWPGAFGERQDLVDRYKAKPFCCIMLIRHGGPSSIYSTDRAFIERLIDRNNLPIQVDNLHGIEIEMAKS